jgi:preprotein translocase subunit SecD
VAAARFPAASKTFRKRATWRCCSIPARCPRPSTWWRNRTISATLGKDSLIKSLNAGLIGLAAGGRLMVIFYRLPGMLANIALAVYCVLNLAVFILVGGT